jgi:hypothetical protein
LTTGAKIAIGCVVAFVLAATVAVVGLGFGAWWLKGKAESVVGEQKKITDLQQRANRNNPFVAPADGVIQESRLLKFLDVRKRVFAIYEQHKTEIDARGNKKQADFGDMKAFLGIMNEVRLAQAQALVDVGMSEDEYRFLVTSIYKTGGASAFQKETGKAPSQAMGEAMKQVQDSLQKGAEIAKQQGAPGADQISDQDVQKAQKQIAEATDGFKNLDAPQANIDLFRKYETEIKKYSMAGLELAGF